MAAWRIARAVTHAAGENDPIHWAADLRFLGEILQAHPRPEIWPWLPSRHRELLEAPVIADYAPL